MFLLNVTSTCSHHVCFVLQLKKGPEVSEDEKKKFEQEFDEYYQKLQKAKDELVPFLISAFKIILNL